jgi:DNA-binding NtrC family response regulator
MTDVARTKPIILLLDDVMDFRVIMEEYLSSDFQVVSHDNISMATQYLTDAFPLDVLLTDFDLKSPHGRDGLDMAKTVRSRHPHVPIILMSGHGKEEPRIQTFLAMPFTYFVAKTSIHPELKDLLALLFPGL